jgi:hypothetical protein
VVELRLVGLLDSVTLTVPDANALGLARGCWRAGGSIAIELSNGRGDVWTWHAGRERFWSAVIGMGGFGRVGRL